MRGRCLRSELELNANPNAVPIPDELHGISRAIGRAGGRAVLVGGYVRDALLGRESKDYDVEVFGLDRAQLEGVVGELGEVIRIGRAFDVLRVKGLDVDFSLPAGGEPTPGARSASASDRELRQAFAAAARRRDLTINSIGLDLESGAVLDPFGGRADLAGRRLRATDPITFASDPLRALRVARLHAGLGMTPDAELRAGCASLDLEPLPGERILVELRRLLLECERPARGLKFLADTRLVRFFPPLAATVGVPQDPVLHPEGDVWTHTLLVVDAAAGLRTSDWEHDVLLMFAALCHDLGKPATTRRDADARIRSPGHEARGVTPTRMLLERLRAPKKLIARVCLLVRFHRRPFTLPSQSAGPSAYRRLARKLAALDLPLTLLERLARADHFGRSTPAARERKFPAGETFLQRIGELSLDGVRSRSVVQGRHLIEAGYGPGEQFRRLLARCRTIQDETGWTDPERIVSRLVHERGPRQRNRGIPPPRRVAGRAAVDRDGTPNAEEG